MPVSKKRKKKQSSGPPPSKTKVATPKKKKLSKQQIIIYVISGLMILSLAIGLVATGSSRRASAQPTPIPQVSSPVLETPIPDNQSSNQPGSDTTTVTPSATPTAQ